MYNPDITCQNKGQYMAGQILRNKKFILISITAAVICALYLIFGWRVSVNRLINLLVSVHVLGIVLISIYYLSCRYIWPEWTKKPFHRTFSLVLSAFLISFAAAIWGYHYSEFVQTLLEGLYRSSLIQTYFEAGRITAPLVRVCLLLYPVGIVLALILIGMERKLGLFRKEKAVQALLAAAYFIFLVSGLTYVSSTNSFQD
ncbi:MAG: hypothetical protein JXA25_19575, partial [Anaerolineales bacterium]|nr:hypothetical protein [Anaerolineales bacterium]